MVEDFKQAATTLKSEGIRVAAVDGQASPAVAQQLGVRGYPTIMWLHMATKEGDEQPTITIAPHNGRRDAASFVEFAKAASKATALRSKLPQGDAAEAGASPGLTGLLRKVRGRRDRCWMGGVCRLLCRLSLPCALSPSVLPPLPLR